MARKSKIEKSTRIDPADPRKPLDETLPRGEMHMPPSRMDPDGGRIGDPLNEETHLKKDR